MPQIKCKDLTLAYDGRVVSENINFQIEKGDYFCIVGDNGSGKTTLMKALLGLKNYDAGEIHFGDDIRNYDIGYLPQQTEIQKDFPATVEEIVRSGCVAKQGIFPFYRHAERTEAISNMKIMGVEGLARSTFSQLSGGQKQKVLLARALCAARKVLLLDEPVASLDPASAEELYSVIRHLNHHLGITIIMITHDISAILDDADKVLYMSRTPTLYGSAKEYAESKHFPHRVKEDNANEDI